MLTKQQRCTFFVLGLTLSSLLLAHWALTNPLPEEPSNSWEISGYEVTDKQKEQIINGLRGAASLMKFLQEKNFFKLLTTISSVAGPIFSVAVTLINIVFMFIEIESPEMKQLKVEFTKLNNRLDQWSEEFSEIKRMIDWSAIQVSFGQHERSIRTMSDHLVSLVNCPADIRDTQRLVFISKYESSFLNTAEKLYGAMINTEMVFSENLFRASQVYTEYDRNRVQQFMLGNFQLLMKAVEIQASYIQLKYNSTNATDFTKTLWEKKFQVLEERMQQIDDETKNRWLAQSQLDLDSLLAKHYSLANKEFEEVLYNHIANKYNWRRWAVVTYGDISGWDNHAVLLCGNTGAFRFRSHGRNVHIASVEPDAADNAGEKLRKAQQVLDKYEREGVPPKNRDFARTIMETLSGEQSSVCDSFKYIGVAAWGSNVWYMNIADRMAYRKLCMRFTGHCFNVFLLV